MKYFFAVAIMALAVAIAVMPQFYTCQHAGMSLKTDTGKSVPMKCNWTAQAEIAAGIPLFAVGAVMLFSKRKETKIVVTGMGMVLGVAAILIPEQLIGVCSSQMPCNNVMEPSLLAMGAAVIAVSAVGMVSSLMSKEKQL